MKNLTTMIEYALTLPCGARTFHVSRQLGELHPGQSVHAFYECGGAVDQFLRYGHADAEVVDRMWAENWLHWDVANDAAIQEMRRGLFQIAWRGERFTMLRIEADRAPVYFIVGPTEAQNQALFTAIQRSAKLVEREVLLFGRGSWLSDLDLARELDQASFDDLVLPEKLQADLIEQVEGFFAARAEYARYGIPWKRGLLLAGPPGNGKTQAIRAIAGRLSVPRLFVRNFDDQWGDEGDGVDEVFARVREAAPCLLVLEDLDSLVGKSFLSRVLNQLDGVKTLEGVLVVATTNHPERLDPAIQSRPSRFDRVLRFEAPDAGTRERYLARMTGAWDPAMRPLVEDVPALVGATDGFSFAFMKELLLSGLMRWMHERRPGSMGALLLEIAPALRAQIAAAAAPVPDEED